jgi:hypothetical protein
MNCVVVARVPRPTINAPFVARSRQADLESLISTPNTVESELKKPRHESTIATQTSADQQQRRRWQRFKRIGASGGVEK